MFTNFHHASYLVPDLNAAVESYAETFGGLETGRGTVPGLGEVGFVQVGNVEVEFIQPEDPAGLAGEAAPVLHHLAYAVDNLDQVVADHKSRGYRFETEEPFTNFMGYRLIYLDSAHTHGTRIHLTDAATLRSEL
jgi:methylmalonyl-CoA/ethylmalonyl-CoA epimerase